VKALFFGEKMPNHKPRVVYLLGTGASHAILKFYDQSNAGVLMSDIAEEVIKNLVTDDDKSLKELCNIPYSMPESEGKYQGVNIENIITLYESSGTTVDRERSEKLRNYFRIAVNKRISKIRDNVKRPPDMITALIDMYSLKDFEEELCAILTLNYDNLIEEAMLKNYGEINLPFETIPLKNNNKDIPVLCKLHGSFNWENTNPVKINDSLLDIDNTKGDILWVPPGVLKRNDYYPFNLIWGTARSYLKCDILRIIGCSLNINDLGLVSLLHTTNRLRQDEYNYYDIEFIDRPRSYYDAIERFPLNLVSIIDIPGFLDYIETEHVVEYSGKKGINNRQKIETWLDSENVNIFELWLKAKTSNLSVKYDIEKTSKGFLYKFYKGLT
jgi:hypothetical protein